MSIVPERFIAAREAKGWSQKVCAEKLHTSQQNISDIERGENKNPRNLAEYARILGVSQSWLRGETDTPNIPAPSALKRHPIPILTFSGIELWLRSPILTPQHKVMNMVFSENDVSNFLFSVIIEGDSMFSPQDIQRSYLPGDIAIIDPDKEPLPGNGVLIKTENELKLRLLTRDGTESVLEAINPKYPNIKLSKDIKIIGTVLMTVKPRC